MLQINIPWFGDVKSNIHKVSSEKNEGEDWKERKGECLRGKYGI